MTVSPTPICDLIERLLLSQELSRGTVGQALEAARPIEAALARGSRTTEEKREIERLRKAAYRARKSEMSHGTKPLHIDSSIKPNSQNLLKKESKEESGVPLSHGTPVPLDDWPADYLDVFWREYPPGRKTGKKAVAAKLAGIRKRGEITFERLIAGVRRYAGSSPDPQYTKAPEVWLNKGCWDDEITLFERAPEKTRGNGFAAARLRRFQNQQGERTTCPAKT
jgi:hypothetical protein